MYFMLSERGEDRDRKPFSSTIGVVEASDEKYACEKLGLEVIDRIKISADYREGFILFCKSNDGRVYSLENFPKITKLPYHCV